MTAMEVGERLVALCREGKNLEAIDQLYDADVVSVEAAEGPSGEPRMLKGVAAVRGKTEWWLENHEIHESTVEGPFPNGDDLFAAIFDFEVTFRPENQRFRMKEVAVYRVVDGKIVREDFFYRMG